MINWEEQWALHAPGFKEGLLHLDKGLKLKAGPGFGDFSHPTTRLVTALMPAYVEGKKVLDIGCGSGILALSALLQGARSAIGFDIDEEAVSHARENAAFNNLNAAFYHSKEIELVEADVALMNMIYSEQCVAWNHFPVQWIITSGVLSSQREEYLAITSGWGWQLLEEKEEEGWLGFVFKT